MPQRDEISLSFSGWNDITTLEDFLQSRALLEPLGKAFSGSQALDQKAIDALSDARIIFFLQGDPLCRIDAAGGDLFPYDPESIEQVREADGFLSYRAKQGGYASYDGALTIISPIIEKDPYILLFRNLPTSQASDCPGSFLSWWCQQFRKHNSDPNINCTDPREAAALISPLFEDIPVVSGVYPEEGRDSAIEILVSKEKPDKSLAHIDYKGFHNYLVCSQNQLLVVKRDPFPGRAGVTIRGERTEVKPGKEIPFHPGEHIRVEREDGTERFYAEIAGTVHLDAKSISVSELFLVEKDVNLSTGNIVYQKDVLVKGSLTSGFSIYSEGSVFIAGVVESGCEIRAKGDVEVAGGVVGSITTIRAGGNIHLGFVQEARIYCEKKLEITKGSMNAHLFGAREVKILGKGLKDTVSTLIGGTVISMEQIEIPSVGSPNQDSSIILGYNPYAENTLNNMTAALKAVERHITSLMEKNGLDSDVAKAKEQIRRMLPGQRSRLKEQLVDLKKSGDKRGELQKQIMELQKAVYQEDEALLRLVIGKRALPKVVVKMKNREKVLLDPESAVEFRLLDGEIERRLS
jgi:uncharacterized protein